jgi:hypothetical protein
MRIYEITQKKLTNEGILGGLASTIATGAIKSVLGPGVDPAFKGQKVSPGQAQAAGMAQSKALIGPMSKNAQEVWLQDLQNMIKTSVTSGKPVTSAKDLDAAVIDKELRILIDRLANVDTRKLATATDPSGEQQQIAKELDAASAEVVKQSKTGTTQGLPAAWDKLAEYIVQTQNIMAFAQGKGSVKPAVLSTGSDGKPLFDGQPYNKNDQAHRATVKIMGQNPDTWVPVVATP